MSAGEWVCSRCGRSTRNGRTPWSGRLILCERCVAAEEEEAFQPARIECCESGRATGGAYHRQDCEAAVPA